MPSAPVPHNSFWRESPQIPAVAHFVWLGGPLPRFVTEFVGRFEYLHPDWEIDVHRAVPLDFPEHWHRHLFSLKSHASRSDWVRLWLIHRLGGFYLDTDVWAFRSFEALRHYRFLTLGTGKGWSNNALFAEAAGGPAVRELIRHLEEHTFALGNPFFVEPRSGWKWSKYYNAGPALFTMAGLERPDLFHLSPKHWFQGAHNKEVRMELVHAGDAELPELFEKRIKMPDGVWPFGLHCGSESDRLAFPDPECGSPRALREATAILSRIPLDKPINGLILGDAGGTLAAELLAHAPRLHLTIVPGGTEIGRECRAVEFAAHRRAILPPFHPGTPAPFPDRSLDLIHIGSVEGGESTGAHLGQLRAKLGPGRWLSGIGAESEIRAFAATRRLPFERDEAGLWFVPGSPVNF